MVGQQDPDDDPEIRELEQMEAEQRAEQRAKNESKWSGISPTERACLTTIVVELSEIALGSHRPPEIERDMMRKVVEQMAGGGLRAAGIRVDLNSVVALDRFSDALITRQAVTDVVNDLLREASADPEMVLARILAKKEPDEDDLKMATALAMSAVNRLSFFGVGWRAHCKVKAKDLLADLGVETSPPDQLTGFVAGLRDGSRTLVELADLDDPAEALALFGLRLRKPSGQDSGAGCAGMALLLVVVPLVMTAILLL